MEIALGTKVRDKITGFVGVAVCKTDWMYGCRRYGVQAVDIHEGKPVEVVYFDEPQLCVITEAASSNPKSTGGPRENENSRRKDAAR
jgi:hypothetical protein